MILSWDLVAKLEVYILLDIFFKVLRYRHGRRKDFFQGGAVGDFPKIFPRGGPKVVKFVFYPSKLQKQPFFVNNFKIRGARPPLPPPSDAHSYRYLRREARTAVSFKLFSAAEPSANVCVARRTLGNDTTSCIATTA